eukprot:CAMPEP_0114291176 /NCGR_PEP_ID=MMETSP0059-20121206/8342_1 /TAXON_ID=36894 /ORGANISM="Pyramimonas parkeae, Strain CCMP726" /LENGTH=628 /DNA_ID=CAMNT_0001412647 /DNA_START=195 /DNA_END=2082 /DNA_ORIENTATION=+
MCSEENGCVMRNAECKHMTQMYCEEKFGISLPEAASPCVDLCSRNCSSQRAIISAVAQPVAFIDKVPKGTAIHLNNPKLHVSDTLVVDCLHPTCPTLTHHKGGRTPDDFKADTSGETVLNAIKAEADVLNQVKFVTCNHYDIDGLVAVWAAMHPTEALKHHDLLRQASIIGDLRELDLDAPMAKEALHLCCWSNAVERSLFYRPFDGSESEGANEKYGYFLPRLRDVLIGLERGKASSVCSEGQEEYAQVVDHLRVVCEPSCVKKAIPEHSLIVLTPAHPVHYYALFSKTIGYDVLLTMYPGNRYELECKYTGYVDIVSRPVMPRIDMSPLVKFLNTLETLVDVQWTCSRFTDSGPIMRLDSLSNKLTKAQRYGNPCERPIFSSSVRPEQMQMLVESFFEHALLGVSPKRFWTWEELQRINRSMDWAPWKERAAAIASQDAGAAGDERVTGGEEARVSVVVVLGCKPSSESLSERVTTGVAAWRREARLGNRTIMVLSGWASEPGGPSEAEAMAKLAAEMGVPASDILQETKASSTLENAQAVHHLLVASMGWTPAHVRHLTVVTSDWHMARAMTAFNTVLGPSRIPLKYSSASSSGLPETLRPQVEAREACAQKKMAASCATLNANI